MLAVSSFRLGDHARAHSYYQRAVEETAEDTANPEVINYRKEASRVFGREDSTAAAR